MSAIDVIGERPVNTGKAEQLDTLGRTMRLIRSSRAFRAFSWYVSRFDISHILSLRKGRSSGPRLPLLLVQIWVAAEVRGAGSSFGHARLHNSETLRRVPDITEYRARLHVMALDRYRRA